MPHPSLRPRPALVLAGILAVILVATGGCASLRQGTYPPDFVYLTRDDLDSAMQELASHIGAMSALLDDLAGGSDEGPVAAEMVGHVDAMRSVTDRLGVGAAGTNHLLLDAHLSQFVDSLDATRRTLNASPPRFYEAGRLVGSCNACHRFR